MKMDEIEDLLESKIRAHEGAIQKLKATLEFYQQSKGGKTSLLPSTELGTLLTNKIPLKERVLLAIQANNRFTKTVWIVHYLKSSYPVKDEIKFRMQISALLSDYRKEGKLVAYRYGPGKRDTVWGFQEWMDANNRPKNEYRYILNEND